MTMSMSRGRRTRVAMLIAAMWLSPTAFGNDSSPPPGADIASVRSWLIAHNPELRALQAEAEAAEARVFPAGALPDPMVGLRLEGIDTDRPNLLPGNVGKTLYSVKQTVPLWGKRGLARDIAGEEARAQREMRSATLLDRLAETEQAYVGYWHADASLQVVDRLIELIGTIESVARQRYALGLAAQQDAIRAQVARTRLQAERIEREAKRADAIAQLNAGLGRPVDAPLASPEGAPNIDLPIERRDQGLAMLRRQSHPMLRARAAMASAADEAFDLQRRQRFPDLNVGVGLMQQGNRLEGYELMLEVEIPFQRRALREREREAALRRDAANARVDQTRDALEAAFGKAWARWASARERESLYHNTLLPQSEANFASALASYRVGEVDFATLLEALEAWQGADLSRIDAQRDELNGAADLRALIGSTP